MHIIMFYFNAPQVKSRDPYNKKHITKRKYEFLRISFILQELFHKEQNLNAMAKPDLFVRIEEIFIIMASKNGW